jgi:glutaredoxin-related protein
MNIKTQKSTNEVIKNSIFGKDVWNKIESKEVKKNFKRYFHLRPTLKRFYNSFYKPY